MTAHADELEAAIEIAHAAGRLLVERADRIEQVAAKGPRDLVTDVDRRAEELILGRLRERYPGDGLLAEESGAAEAAGGPGQDARTWVVDPLDGTINYANGIPIYCVSIALVVDDRPVVGVVHDPVRGETFDATADGPARLDGRPIRASSKDRLSDWVVSLTLDPGRAAQRGNALAEAIRVHRRLGSAALALAWVGCGRFDAFAQTYNLSAWDVAAGGLIAARAGARVRDLDDGPYVELARGSRPYGVVAAPEARFDPFRRLVG